LGYIIGDGRMSYKSIRLRDHRLSVLKVYGRIFSNAFGINYTTRPVTGKRCYELDINSVDIAALFRRLVNEWRGVVSRSTTPNVASFIRGFADAEGSITGSLSIAQKDRTTLEICQLLLLQFGIKSTIRVGKGCHVLRIAEGTSLANFQRDIGLSAPDKSRKLNRAIARSTRIGADLIPIDVQALWDLVKSTGVKPSKLIKHRHAGALTRTSLTTFVEALKRNPTYRNAPPYADMTVRKLEKLATCPLIWERIRSITNEKRHMSAYGITPYANAWPRLISPRQSSRIFLRRTASGPVRICRLVSSPYLPEGERIFKVTEEGIKDITEEDEVKRRR
jgi:hypothetical protein